MRWEVGTGPTLAEDLYHLVTISNCWLPGEGKSGYFESIDPGSLPCSSGRPHIQEYIQTTQIGLDGYKTKEEDKVG